MKYPRAFGNGVVLPNGQVLVVGGQYYAVPFSDSTPSLPAELFDPVTNTWSTMASIAVPRNYHSVAILLPDATVLSAGGGICGLNSVSWYVEPKISHWLMRALCWRRPFHFDLLSNHDV